MGAFANEFLLLVHNPVAFFETNVSGFFLFLSVYFHQTFFGLKPIFFRFHFSTLYTNALFYIASPSS